MSTSVDNISSNVSYGLQVAPSELNIYFGIFLWVIGNIGCIGNMLVFSSRKFRNRAYAIYLFWGAVADFHYFNFVLITRVLQNGFRIPLMTRYLVLCKLREFSTIWGNVVGFSFFAFAIIDRLLSAQRQNKYRQWSNRTSLAYKMVFISTLIWFILICHRIILYRIENGSCGPPSGVYSYYDNYFQVIFSSLAPAIGMSILAYLLLKSVRGVVRRRIAPVNNPLSINIQQKNAINQVEAQVTTMLLLESIIAIITYVPYASQLTYANVTQNWHKTPLYLAWESVFTETIHLFSYVFFATSFYVSTASSIGFRRQVKILLGIKKDNHLEDQTVTLNRNQGAVNMQTEL